MAGRIMSMKNSDDTTRDLPTCSAVPQPTVLRHAATVSWGLTFCKTVFTKYKKGIFFLICHLENGGLPCKLNMFFVVVFLEIWDYEEGHLMCRVILYLVKYSVQMNFRLQRVKEYCCVLHSFLWTVLECTHGMIESICLTTLWFAGKRCQTARTWSVTVTEESDQEKGAD
jgi:hypothetical protein